MQNLDLQFQQDLQPDKEMVAAIDVGGTNTRIQLTLIDKHSGYYQPVFLERYRINTKKDLARQLSRIFQGTVRQKIRFCCIDFAGPVYNHQQVMLTNWKDKPFIKLEDLYGWGLPAGHTLMVNDIEAGAFAIIDLMEAQQLDRPGCYQLYQPHHLDSRPISPGNMVVLVPGTGLGTAGIVMIREKDEKIRYQPVPAEMGHAPVNPLNHDHESVIGWLIDHNKDWTGQWPTWEDFVSGRGLIRLYQGLANTSPCGSKQDIINQATDPAALIAQFAIQHEDNRAEKALDLYLRCLGQAAQVLALAYQPFGGIFLCGDVIAKNRTFVAESGLMEVLHRNDQQAALVKMFPVYLITRKNLNIMGGLWAARNHLNRTESPKEE